MAGLYWDGSRTASFRVPGAAQSYVADLMWSSPELGLQPWIVINTLLGFLVFLVLIFSKGRFMLRFI